MPERRAPRLAIVVFCLLVSAHAHARAHLDRDHCPKGARQGSGAALDCGWLVTGDRIDGQPVRLWIAILRARPDAHDSTPVIYVPGGPGGSAGLDADSLQGWRAWQQRAGWAHDIVLFDPRGTGRSRPRPRCEVIRETRTAAAGRAPSSRREFDSEARAAKRCYKDLGRATAAALGPQAQLRDLDALIGALGVDRVNLWGVSYGTRLARLYAARHPMRVRALALDSLLPFEQDDLLAMPDQIGGAIAALDDYCAWHGDCVTDGRTPSATVHALLARYAESPASVTTRAPGHPQRFRVTPYRLLMMVLFAGYEADHAAGTVARLTRAARGDDRALVALVDRLWRRAFDRDRSAAVFWSTRCAFGHAGPSAHAWQRVLADHPDIRAYLAGARRASVCRFWRVPAISPPAANAPLDSPTLVLTGSADAVTPGEWARRFVAAHPDVRLLEVADTGHAAGFASRCALQAMHRFWQAPDAPRLPDCAHSGR